MIRRERKSFENTEEHRHARQFGDEKRKKHQRGETGNQKTGEEPKGK